MWANHSALLELPSFSLQVPLYSSFDKACYDADSNKQTFDIRDAFIVLKIEKLTALED